MGAETINYQNELYESTMENLKEIDAVKVQMTNALTAINEIDQKSFYTIDNNDGKVKYNMGAVKAYLNTIKDKTRNELKAKNVGAWIMAVQIALESKGYDVGKIDGRYGSQTGTAVKKFQEAQGLNPDSYPGTDTIKALLKVLNGETVGTPAGSNSKQKSVGTTERQQTKIDGVTINDLKKIDIKALGGFNGTNFQLKSGIEKTDKSGKYIEIGGKKYYEYKEGMSGLGYKSGISIDGKGVFYIGKFENGKKEGFGILRSANGDKYEGNWKNDTLEGFGTFTWANGNKYEGNWKNNNREGKGTQTWANGNKYEGNWKNGQAEGKGTQTWENGDKYEGNWKNGQAEGYGKKTYNDGTPATEGVWRDGKFKEANTEWYKKKCEIIKEQIDGDIKTMTYRFGKIGQTVDGRQYTQKDYINDLYHRIGTYVNLSWKGTSDTKITWTLDYNQFPNKGDWHDNKLVPSKFFKDLNRSNEFTAKIDKLLAKAKEANRTIVEKNRPK